jgi:hypothetical protein
MAEFKLKVEDFEQFLGALTTFDTTLAASCCQATIGLKETTMFNKWTTGKSDLFTSAIHIDEEQEGRPDVLTLFIPNVKKLIVVLKNIGKYYDIKDSTLFSSGKVKIVVCDQASYIRIASPKYNIKFQLSTNAIMESQLGNIEKVLVPSKYGDVVHQAANLEDLQENFLMTAKIDASKFSEINDLMSTLSETTESSIKIQTPEQAKIEDDVVRDPLTNTLYATVSDNQKLVKSNIGNKISVEFGKITFAAENYKDICPTNNTTQNFVFLCNKTILDSLASTCRSFVSASKAKDIEIVISKLNLMHLNLNVMSQNAKSEIYVTVIGVKASAMF